MPKQTFFNLKKEKQEKIINSAIDEFSISGYFDSNISRISKNSNISVGSFYQYFDDINDLYMYVLLNISNLKTEYIKKEMEKIDTDNFKAVIEAVYWGAMKFALLEPYSYKISNSFINLMNTSKINDLMKYHKDNGEDFLSIHIENAIKTNQLRPEITPILFTKLMTNINLSIIDYMQILKSEEDFNEENLKKLCQLATSILLNGTQNGG